MPGEIVLAALVPHHRSLLDETDAAPASRKALWRLGAILAEARPDVLVVVDPHLPGAVASAFGLYGAPTLRGDLSYLGAPQLTLEATNDLHLQYLIAGLSQEVGLPLVITDRFQPQPVGHGTILPLQLLRAAGLPKLPLVLLSPGDLSLSQHHQLGQVIAFAAERSGRRVAVLASGHLSHRHGEAPDAAQAFDARIQGILAASDWPRLLGVPMDDVKAAGDCGTRGLAVLAGLGHRSRAAAACLSYEVSDDAGLLVAQVAVTPPTQPAAAARPGRDVATLADLALEAIYCQVAKGEVIAAQGALHERFADQQAGVFVSLYHQGRLHGSLGSVLPMQGDVCDEVIQAAVALARLPDQARLTAADLPHLTVTVHVVGSLEPVDRPQQVDPSVFGLLASNGFRHGVILPGCEGVTTATDQIQQCIAKLQLLPGEPVWLYRFTTEVANSWDAKALTLPKRR